MVFSWLQKLQTYVKLNVKLIFEKIVNEPALAEPPGPFLIRFQPKPIIVCCFIVLNILKDKRANNSQIVKLLLALKHVSLIMLAFSLQ